MSCSRSCYERRVDAVGKPSAAGLQYLRELRIVKKSFNVNDMPRQNLKVKWVRQIVHINGRVISWILANDMRRSSAEWMSQHCQDCHVFACRGIVGRTKRRAGSNATVALASRGCWSILLLKSNCSFNKGAKSGENFSIKSSRATLSEGVSNS